MEVENTTGTTESGNTGNEASRAEDDEGDEEEEEGEEEEGHDRVPGARVRQEEEEEAHRLAELRKDKSHHTGKGAAGRFRNPWTTFESRKAKDFIKFARGNGESFPTAEVLHSTYPVEDVKKESLAAPDPDVAQITWIGHATLLIQMEGVNVLTDPVWANVLCPPWLRLIGIPRFTQVPLSLEELPSIDVVLLSHNHYDHCDADALRRLASTTEPPLFIVPLGLGDWLRENNGTKDNPSTVIELDWWEEHALPNKKEQPGLRIIATPCQHWSNRGLFDKCLSLWCSFAIIGKKRIFFAGDTGYCPAFKEIGDLLGPFDLAALPIGAYEPRETHKSIHINPEEAVMIHIDLRSQLSIGIHFGTYGGRLFGYRPIVRPKEDLAAGLEKHGVDPSRFITLSHGRTLTIGDNSLDG